MRTCIVQPARGRGLLVGRHRFGCSRDAYPQGFKYGLHAHGKYHRQTVNSTIFEHDALRTPCSFPYLAVPWYLRSHAGTRCPTRDRVRSRPVVAAATYRVAVFATVAAVRRVHRGRASAFAVLTRNRGALTYDYERFHADGGVDTKSLVFPLRIRVGFQNRSKISS